MAMRRKKTENRKRMFVLAPLNGRQSMCVIWKDAKVEERTELSQSDSRQGYRCIRCKNKEYN